jgi:hypothetical protein
MAGCRKKTPRRWHLSRRVKAKNPKATRFNVEHVYLYEPIRPGRLPYLIPPIRDTSWQSWPHLSAPSVDTDPDSPQQ